MSIQPSDKKEQIIAELGEEQKRQTLLWTMEQLDKYAVTSSSAKAEDELIALLKPVLREQAVSPATNQAAGTGVPVVFRLVRPQAMLLSRWFILVSALVLLAGLVLANAADGDTLRFLANASPILGLLTVLYEFRAKLSSVNELEAACPYSPAQLAAARLLVVLGYDILLCLAVTPVVGYWQGLVLWQVVISWLAPLLFMLGIALAVSLRLGIFGGCLVSGTVWALQFAVNRGGSVFLIILPGQSVVLADLISLAMGVALILYSYRRWNAAMTAADERQGN